MARNRRPRRKAKPQNYTAPEKVRETVEITELGRRGDGIATLANGETCFVPHTLAGEIVEVERSGNRSHIIEIKNASPDRVDPICPHFGTCGGCALQHVSPALYQNWKRGIVETALSHKGLTPEIDPLIDGHGEGRRRVTFHAKREKNEVSAGFMKARSHRILDLDACPILEPTLAPGLDIARAFAALVPTRSKPLDIQFTATDNGLDCNILGAAIEGAEIFSEVTELANEHNLARVSFNSEIIIERQPPSVMIGEAKLTLPSASFLQATQAGEEILANLLLEHLEDASKIADLFCGLGPYALRLAEFAAIYAADNDAASIAALTHAANNAQNLKAIEAVERDLFEMPLMPAELNKFEAVLFDPPRAGAKEQAEQLAASSVKLVVAVSCDPVSFARDAAILVEGGYDLKCVTPVDQFKYTAHVELVALFERG
ncbi:MAG: class I SAM-dependent RNA methyltransferase [Rhodospirillaceae bacterium]|nr:class I SAM-dependent RNA methyltransferase [Rhodospirillaceae bacterium]